MATPRQTLKAVQALHGRSVTLLADFEVVMPAAYRERSDASTRSAVTAEMPYQAWHASRHSLSESVADLRWLEATLAESLPPPACSGAAHTARDDDAGHVARDGP